ncbi:MAG: radical SAM protein [Sterolibacterium sp.]
MLCEWTDHQVFGARDGAILFGVDQGSLFFIDAETRDALARWNHGPTLDLDAVPPADREILEGLRTARFLAPAGVRHRLAAADFDIAAIPLTTMVLEVAQDCNLNCTYCYADGGSYGRAARFLDPDTARQAVRKLVADSADRDTVTLVIFGGEPLLNMPAVEAAVLEARIQSQQTGKQVFVSLTTNGTLLKPAIIDFIHANRIAVSVSLDGPADLHDANRPCLKGKGSYATITDNLAGLLSGATAPVAARVTLTPDQWPRIEEVFFHLMDLGFHEVGIAPVSPVRRNLLPDAAQEEALLQGFSAMAGIFLKAAKTNRLLPFTNLIDLLARLHLGQTKSVSCGAGYGYLAVDAAGSFYVCHRLVGDENFLVGNLDDGAVPAEIRRALDSVTCGKQEMCSSCWARTLCSGGCHYENHLRENQLGLPPGGSCDFIRRWFQLGIEVYAELRRTGAEEILQRLGKRVKC